METVRNSNQKKILFECVFLGSLIMIGLRFPVMNIIALALLTIFVFRASREEIFCLMIFLVSLAPIFKLQIGGFTFYNFVWIIALARLLLMNGFRLSKSAFSYVLFFGVYALITGGNADLIGIISVVCSLTVAMLLFQEGERVFSIRSVVECAAFGVVFSSCIAMMGTAIFPRLSIVLESDTVRLAPGEYYYRFAGLMGNPNYYTMMISIIQAVLCVLIINRQARLKEYLYFFVLAVLGFMAASMSYILTFAVMVVLLIVYYCRNNANRFLGWFILIIVFGIATYQFLGTDTIEAILFRMKTDTESGDLNDITSGRSGLWLYYLDYLISNPLCLLFGVGLGARNLPIGASHSYYIDILYYLGVIGGALYIGCLGSIFKISSSRITKVRLYYYLPFLILLTRCAAINAIMNEQLVFYFMLCTLALSIANGKTTEY